MNTIAPDDIVRTFEAVRRRTPARRDEERSGRAMTDLRWYQTLALWRSVVFMDGLHRRAVARATDDPYLAGFGDTVLELAERARDVAGLRRSP